MNKKEFKKMEKLTTYEGNSLMEAVGRYTGKIDEKWVVIVPWPTFRMLCEILEIELRPGTMDGDLKFYSNKYPCIYLKYYDDLPALKTTVKCQKKK